MSIWDLYKQHQVSPEITRSIRHADVVRILGELQAIRPESMTLRELGHSHEGRSIQLATLGSGSKKVFAWSQMHGNEPTHTAVLFDLINFLQRSPHHSVAKGILENCTLYLLPMLNPDGAERYTRRNAQGIDINRDALLLQSPEGRLLRQTVLDLQPEIALNLHNQTPRKSVGHNPARVAAVSLLVPPLDAEDTQTAETRLAKQLAGKFVAAVQPHCQGHISRYDADFMPRCFGEWVQQQGAATLTVEAGGWTTPSAEHSPLVQIHFLGIVSVLASIADENYETVATDVYDRLPRSNEYDLFDIKVCRANVFLENSKTPIASDIGINFQALSDDCRTALEGIVADLGDLSVTNGKDEFVADDLVCLPGRIARVPEVSPNRLPSSEGTLELLRAGVTSVIGTLDLSSTEQLDAFAALDQNIALPLNLGFVAEIGQEDEPGLLSALLRAIALGLLGVVGKPKSSELAELLDWYQIVPIAHDTLSFAPSKAITFADYQQETQQSASLLQSINVGTIALGARADLVFLQLEPPVELSHTIDWAHLRRVFVGGNVVWDDGEPIVIPAGRLLTNKYRATAG